MSVLQNKPVQQMANCIRALAMDAVQKANSGHPGMPMGMADIAVALWADTEHGLKHNPNNPKWVNRDRFILSNGHGSMLLYALLHLTGYDLSIQDIQQFRQLGSKTPGHPENHLTPGVETTTGPLGQGLANGVGMALAEKLLAHTFNRDGFPIVDHYTYVFMGDGCLMEGISHEACSLAGTWQLNKLIVFWDDNGISIDGKVEGWFTDDTPARFESYGWAVIRGVDGHDALAVNAALHQAKNHNKPTLICCKTTIGKGAPGLEGTDKVHGAPLGEAAIAKTREQIDWPHAPFVIPPEIYEAWNGHTAGKNHEHKWNQLFNKYQEQYPALAAEFLRRQNGNLPEQLESTIAQYLDRCQTQAQTMATRKASQDAINALAPVLSEFLGGSADLTGSNLTKWQGCQMVDASGAGNYISYGVREFAMCAITNGIALHGGFIPFSGTFLTFADYARNALRMAALMRLRNIFVFTHDSIGVGEDGPTHQPIEHITSLRIIPHMDVWRPCDTVETAVAWAQAIRRTDGPTSLVLTRQNLPFQARQANQVADIAKGGYRLRPQEGAVLQILATGSEIGLAIGAQDVLSQQGIAVEVVSMPSTTVFDRQPADYRESVLPKHMKRVAIEAGDPSIWWKYGCQDVIGMQQFGESAPAAQLFTHFGLTVDALVETVKKALTL